MKEEKKIARKSKNVFAMKKIPLNLSIFIVSAEISACFQIESCRSDPDTEAERERDEIKMHRMMHMGKR